MMALDRKRREPENKHWHKEMLNSLLALDVTLDWILAATSDFLSLDGLHLTCLFQILARLGHVEHPWFHICPSRFHYIGDTVHARNQL